jgi:biofilm protein TabA
MITAGLSDTRIYSGLNRNFSAAFEFLHNNDLKTFSPGKYGIIGEDLFVIISEYDSKPGKDCTWEAHRKYIDIQCILEGHEKIGWAPLDSLQSVKAYDPEKDVEFFAGSGEDFTAGPGGFLIFFPGDGHKPGQALSGPEKIKKACFKVQAE